MMLVAEIIPAAWTVATGGACISTSKPRPSNSRARNLGVRLAIPGRIVGRDLYEGREEFAFGGELTVDEARDRLFAATGARLICLGRGHVIVKLTKKSRKVRAARSASASLIVSSGLWLIPP